jgi:hypothetical protein
MIPFANFAAPAAPVAKSATVQTLQNLLSYPMLHAPPFFDKPFIRTICVIRYQWSE